MWLRETVVVLLVSKALGFHSKVFFGRPRASLSATIFYPTDDPAGSTTESDLLAYSATPSPIPDKLSNPALSAPLARLAAGNRPGLKIESIHQVAVHNFDVAKIDIEALVCEEGGCVSLSVPVKLPQPCYDHQHDVEQFEDCILENLQQLDRAEQEAAKNKVFLTQEEMEAMQQLRTELHNRKTVSYPDWWIYPDTNLELSKECDSLIGILNEDDFKVDMLRLAKSRAGHDDVTVRQVAVVAIGPAGMILRATAYQNDSFLGLGELPIAFGVASSDPNSLRAAVLNTVEGDV